jgi:phospholipid/cholesterol/gamma-HCH transport system substrate-binding protein
LNESKILELKVGITILVGLVLLMLSIVWIKGITFKPNTYNVAILFPNTAGLQVGDPVNISGMKVGKVVDLDLEGDSVLVNVSVSNSVVLKYDATAVISSVDFFGAKKIEMIPGTDEKIFDRSYRMKGTREPDLSELTSQFRDIGLDIKTTLKKVDSILIATNSVVGDRSFTNSLKRVAHNLDTTTSRINTIVAKSDIRVDSAFIKINLMLRSYRQLAEHADMRLDTTFKDVRSIALQIAGVTSSLDSIVRTVQNGEGNLGKMVYDESVYNKLDHAVTQMDSLVSMVRRKGMKVDVKLFGD